VSAESRKSFFSLLKIHSVTLVAGCVSIPNNYFLQNFVGRNQSSKSVKASDVTSYSVYLFGLVHFPPHCNQYLSVRVAHHFSLLLARRSFSRVRCCHHTRVVCCACRVSPTKSAAQNVLCIKIDAVDLKLRVVMKRF